METGTSFGHVSGLGVFEPSTQPGWSAYEALCDRLRRRLGELEPLRRRLVEVPLGLDHPYWIEDPDFDLEFHVRETALPAPGSHDQLSTLVARIIGRPLDRARPLWEAWVIEGLADGRFAVLTKLHHATIDGAAGAELLRIMYEDDPAAVAGETVPIPPAPAAPGQARVMGRALVDVARKPRAFASLQVRSLRAVGDLTRNRGLTGLADILRTVPNPIAARLGPPRRDDPDIASAPPAEAAPATPFNGSITAHRRVALGSFGLAEIKTVKRRVGATVNDVVMAACAGALRRYLIEKEALPERPLVAMVPVSIRSGDESDPWTNRVSAVFPQIPTDEADPLARLARVHQEMEMVKDRFGLLPADMISDYAQFAPPALAVRAAAHGHPAAYRRPGEPAVQPGRLQHPRPPQPPVPRPGPAGGVLPDLDHRRDPGAQHHPAELLRPSRLRPGLVPGAGPRRRPSRRPARRGARLAVRPLRSGHVPRGRPERRVASAWW